MSSAHNSSQIIIFYNYGVVGAAYQVNLEGSALQPINNGVVGARPYRRYEIAGSVKNGCDPPVSLTLFCL